MLSGAKSKVRLGPVPRRGWRPGRMLTCFYHEGGHLTWFDEDADPLRLHPLSGDQVPDHIKHAAAEIAPDWWRANTA